MRIAVLNLEPGTAVLYHGEPCMVLEHRGGATMLVVTNQIEHEFGSTNNYAASALRAHLNGAFLDALTESHPDEIITRKVDLTALNGSTEYGTCECKVAPLTVDEIRRYHGILPKPESWEWSATPWSTPSVNGDERWVVGLNTNGNVGGHYCNVTYGSRPAFLIPSLTAVEDGNNPLEQYSTKELADELARRLDQ